MDHAFADSAQKTPVEKPLSRLWTIGIPILVTALALPVVAGATAVLMLWFIHLWNVSLSYVCILGTILLLGEICLIWLFIRSLARKRFQFTIRSMLIAITLFALFFGLFWNRLNRIWHQQLAIAHVMANGGRITPYGLPKDEQNWLRKKYNFDPFVEVGDIEIWSDYAIQAIIQHPKEFTDLGGLNIDSNVSDEGLEKLEELNRFPKFTSIGCNEVGFTDTGLEQIAKCSNLKNLFFNGASKITDNGLVPLQNLKKMESLTLIAECGSLSITDAGLKHIGQMPQLTNLSLGDMAITDAGMKEIGNLTGLQMLYLSNLPITDEGLKHLSRLNKLRTLYIVQCKSVTRQGVIELGKVLPNCHVKIDSKDAVELIEKIEVWKVAADEKQLMSISDPDRIAKIINYVDEHIWYSSTEWKHFQKDKHLKGVRLDIFGHSHLYFQLLVGSEECSFGYENGWHTHSIPIAEEKEFLELLGLDAAG